LLTLFLVKMQGTVSVWKELPKKLLGQSDFTFAAIMNLINCVILPKENAEWAERTTEHLLSKILVSVCPQRRETFCMILKYSVITCNGLSDHTY